SARGFEASTGGVSLRLGTFVFDELKFAHSTGGVGGERRRVRASCGWSGVTRVAALGGVVRLRGSVDEVRAIVRPKGEEPPREGQSNASALPLFGEGLALDWQRPFGQDSGLSVSGLVLERDQGQLS